MWNRLVFDIWPLFLYFAGDPRVKEMFDEVVAEKAEGYTCETNIAELYH
ncbi:MAG: hypothetical protein RMJ15_06495 [Nitrososphaerota archaeon]|nr:hypothetical protein [Candidatus Bathyarchaeota archaeon]MDW8023368.1 hypothetical protein [Nitrososphaerota archaeon]